MRESDLYDDTELRFLDKTKEADARIKEQILQAAKQCGFLGVEVEYDSLTGGNSVHLYHTMANVASLATFCSLITKIASGVSPIVTIEDGELKIEF